MCKLRFLINLTIFTLLSCILGVFVWSGGLNELRHFQVAQTFLCLLILSLIVYIIAAQEVRHKKALAREYFFKMLGFHSDQIKSLKVEPVQITIAKQPLQEGKQAFIEYKNQLGQLLKLVQKVNREGEYQLSQREEIDIAYVCFYYGVDNRWSDFSERKLKMYKDNASIAQEIQIKVNSESGFQRLGRTNQTNLSSYFRNMFNAIHFVANAKELSHQEKSDLVTIYKAQLSNPELYVIYFYIISRFGHQWRENTYVEKFDFLTNLPLDYCDGYDPKTFFEITFAEERFFAE